MGRDVRPTAEDGPPDPEGADPQGQDKRDGSRGGHAQTQNTGHGSLDTSKLSRWDNHCRPCEYRWTDKADWLGEQAETLQW